MYRRFRGVSRLGPSEPTLIGEPNMSKSAVIVFGMLIVSCSAAFGGTLPVCNDQKSEELSKYALGVAMGADLVTQYAASAAISDATICDQIGSTAVDFEAFLSLNKAYGINPSMAEATLLMAEEIEVHQIGEFCSPIQLPNDPYARFGTVKYLDRGALKPVSNELGKNALMLLNRYIGCAPDFGRQSGR